MTNDPFTRDDQRYFFWKLPSRGLPEAHGFGVRIIPGLGQWAMIDVPPGSEPPPGAIPAEDVVKLLERRPRTDSSTFDPSSVKISYD